MSEPLSQFSEKRDGQSPQAEWLAYLARAGNYNGWIFRSVEPYVRGNVLELGSGTGTFTRLFASVAGRVTAMEIDPVFYEEAVGLLREIENVILVHGDATAALPNEQFNTVVMLDVLEHIEDDVKMMKSLADRLIPGGHVVLKVPAILKLYNSMDAAVGHFRRYDKEGLGRVADAAGLRPMRLQPLNLLGIPGWWWNGVRGNSVAPEAQIGGFDRLVPFLEFLENRLQPPVGLSLIAVLEKQK